MTHTEGTELRKTPQRKCSKPIVEHSELIG